jgi:HlyD family secretion protein
LPAIALVLALLTPAAFAQDLTIIAAQPFCSTCMTATGRVIAPLCAQVGSRVSGTIAEFGKDASGNMIDEGSVVKAGDLLFKLQDTTFANAVAVAEANLKSAQANLDNLKAPARPEKIEQLQAALEELDIRVADRKRDEQRYRRLVEEEKSLPATRLEAVQTELACLQTQRKAAQAKLDEVKNGPTATEIAIAQAKVEENQVALKIAKDDLRDSTVRAPFSGLVARRLKSPGDYATGAPHTDVLTLISTERLEVELRLPEAYLGAVGADKTAVVLSGTMLKKDIKAVIGRLVPNVDTASGTFAVRVAIPADAPLAPGAFVTARVAVDNSTAGVIVPQRAVIQVDGKSYAFVVEGDKMVRRPVEVGDRLTESVIVTSGLQAGQKLLTGPADMLKDGATIPAGLLPASK